MNEIAGRYRQIEVLGRGGMGVVWRAWDLVMSREVAIKELTLPPGTPDADRAAERMLREARAAATSRHPGIVEVHDVLIENGRPWIVMELIRGRSLDEIVHDDGPLPPVQVARIGQQVLSALRTAHAGGVLHRDVKPANILICGDERVVLTDFGIAVVEGEQRLTAAGGLAGTPSYMAPERLRGDVVGPSSDLWSLGATLFAAVEGYPPFRRASLAATMTAVLTEEPPRPRRAGPLTDTLLALLARDPAARPAADRAAHALDQAAEGRSTHIQPAPGGPVPWWLPILIGAGFMLAVAIVTFAVWSSDGGSGTATPPSKSTVERTLPPEKFSSVPSMCGLITRAQADSLVGSGVGSAGGEHDGCTWTGNKTLAVTAEMSLSDTRSGSEVAHAAYAQKRKLASDGIDAEYVFAGDIAGVGEEAYVVDDRGDGGAQIVFRVSNLLVTVEYTTKFAISEKATERGATRAAKWAATALTNS